jgi:hypothetical protein
MFNHKYVVPVSQAGTTIVLTIVGLLFYGVLSI